MATPATADAPAAASGNLATPTLRCMREAPARPAIVDGWGKRPPVTFGDLHRRVAEFSAGLRRAGIGAGDRVVVLFPVAPDFYALCLALFAAGATVVVIDGRLGLRRGLGVLRTAAPKAIVSVRAFLRLWPVLPALWGVRRFASDGGGLGVRPLDALAAPVEGEGEVPVAPRRPEDAALISFTSGSSGKPKGAVRTHGILLGQHDALHEEFPSEPGDVHLSCFPAVGLHNLSCGVTTVLPPMDFRAPAAADPAAILACVERHGVTTMTGAPAFMTRLCEHLERTGATARGVTRLGVGGAPVSRRLCASISRAFPAADARVIYGSTEAEPVASVACAEAASAEGEGFLVGRPARAAEVALVALPEPAPPLGADGLARWLVPRGEIGEVLVRGAHVNRSYAGNPEAERALKLRAHDGSVWHRTGDLARLDAEGRLWLTGRGPDSIRRPGAAPLHTYAIEARLLDLPPVRAAALVQSPRAPAGECVVEVAPGTSEPEARERIAAVLREGGAAGMPVRFIATMPTDARHQSKVDRAALRGGA